MTGILPDEMIREARDMLMDLLPPKTLYVYLHEPSATIMRMLFTLPHPARRYVEERYRGWLTAFAGKEVRGYYIT